MTDPTTRVRAILDAATAAPWSQRGSLVKARDDSGPFTIVNTTDLDGTEADARAIVLSRNLLPAALDVVEAARRREKAEEALADWSDGHIAQERAQSEFGYVINAERNALAHELAEAIHAERAALDAYDAKVQETLGS